MENGVFRQLTDLIMRDDAPAVEVHEGPDPALEVTDPCPHCGENHVHGADDGWASHRASHCDPDTEGRKAGYWLLRRVKTLLGSLRWWIADERDATPNLGFGEAGDDGGSDGLLPVPSEDGEGR